MPPIHTMGWLILGERLALGQWAAIACIVASAGSAVATGRPDARKVDDQTR